MDGKVKGKGKIVPLLN